MRWMFGWSGLYSPAMTCADADGCACGGTSSTIGHDCSLSCSLYELPCAQTATEAQPPRPALRGPAAVAHQTIAVLEVGELRLVQVPLLRLHGVRHGGGSKKLDPKKPLLRFSFFVVLVKHAGQLAFAPSRGLFFFFFLCFWLCVSESTTAREPRG